MSDLNSTMGNSFTGTNMDDMGSAGNAPAEAPSGLSKLKTKLKNAFQPDEKQAAGTTQAPAASPSIYSGIQSTMNGSK